MGDTVTVTRAIREHLPTPLARTAGAVRRRLRGLRYSFAQLPAFPPVATTPVRMLVGPTNSAGQGHAWAQAAKTLPDVDAVSFALHRKGRFQFADDYGVPLAWFGQPRWQRAQQQYVVGNYTHVLVESLRPLFGARGFPDAVPDIEAASAISWKTDRIMASSVAMPTIRAHGTGGDRRPSRQAQKTKQGRPNVIASVR